MTEAATAVRSPRFQKLRAVTLPVLKFDKTGKQARYVAILGAMHEGRKIDDNKDPATLAHAVDMETGEEGLIICSTVLKKELNENYPGEAYVGRGFEVVITRDPEKKYNHVTLSEVSIPDDMAPAIENMRRQSATRTKNATVTEAAQESSADAPSKARAKR